MARGFRRCLAGPILFLLILATVGALPAAASSGEAGSGPKVIGGNDAAPGQFPWVAALALHSDPRDYDAQFCGGTVITPLWVLTASHCVIQDYFVDEDEHGHQTVEVDLMPARDLDVIVAKTDLQSPGVNDIEPPRSSCIRQPPSVSPETTFSSRSMTWLWCACARRRR